MKNLTGAPVIFELNPYEQHKYQMHQLGAKANAANGDIYRYARLASDVSAGYLLTALTKEALHVNLTVAVSNAVGDEKVVLDVGATAVDANEYDEGTLVFNDNSPEGEWYTITAHEANAGSLETDIFVSPALRTATVADSSQASLYRNPWMRPAVSQLLTVPVAGVTVQDWDYSENAYGWIKTRGYASVLSDTTGTTYGNTVTVSSQTNGAVGAKASNSVEPIVGRSMNTGTAGEFNGIYLLID